MIKLPQIYPVAAHTDNVGKGSIFVVIKGLKQDGLSYIETALQKGASSLVLDRHVALSEQQKNIIASKNIECIYVEDPRKELALLSAQYAGYPAQSLRIFGVTGTKGKTTTTHMLAHILRTAGHRVGVISTIKNYIDTIEFPPGLTTPQPDYLHQFLRVCVDAGVTHVVMEVAAQAITLHRVHGITFGGVIFTNFAQEHLEFYTTMDTYFAAKCTLLGNAVRHAPIILNGDDERIIKLRHMLTKEQMRGLFFGINNHNYRMIIDIVDPLKLSIYQQNILICTIQAPYMRGVYNAYNMVASSVLAYELGVCPEIIKKAFLTFEGVSGRMECITQGNKTIILDYAHNPLSYEAIFSTVRAYASYLVAVFGCGGNRDASRRPQMGAIAARYADHIILTNDNPRDEDPQAIIVDIVKGIPIEMQQNITCILDRAQAIAHAYTTAPDHAYILILGRAGETHQEIRGVKYPCCDKSIVLSLS